MSAFLRKHRWVLVGLALTALVVVLLAPMASSAPDGLDRVSQDKEFVEKADDPWYQVLPNYSIPGIDNERLTVVLAGLAGAALVFLLPMGLGYLARRSRRETKP